MRSSNPSSHVTKSFWFLSLEGISTNSILHENLQLAMRLVAFDQFSTEHYEGSVCRWGTGPEKHGALSPCWFNVGQASATLAQH